MSHYGESERRPRSHRWLPPSCNRASFTFVWEGIVDRSLLLKLRFRVSRSVRERFALDFCPSPASEAHVFSKAKLTRISNLLHGLTQRIKIKRYDADWR